MGEFEGYLERVSLREVAGWVWSPAAPWARLAVEISAEGARTVTVVADQYRGDVEAAGKGDGRYGFSTAFECGHDALVSVKVLNGPELTYSPLSASVVSTLISAPEAPASRLLRMAIHAFQARQQYGYGREI